MTSNTMNFGPEWMRRLSKPSTPGTLDLNSRGAFGNSSLPISPLVSPGVNGTQGSFSYSTIAATNTSRRNTINQENSEESFKTYSSESNLDDQLNPFKYSKELMLSLYKNVSMPLDFERHEYVTSEESLQPMANIALDENEKKLLSGSVNSELTRRIVQGSTNTSSFIRNERSSSRSGLATPPRSRGGYAQNSKEFQLEVEKKLEQDPTRFERNAPRDSTGFSQDDATLWTGVNKRVVGTFDNSGVFRFDNFPENDLCESLEPIEKPCHTPESLEEPESTRSQEPVVESRSNLDANPSAKPSEKEALPDNNQSGDQQLDSSQANRGTCSNDLPNAEVSEKLRISTNPNIPSEERSDHLGFKREDLGSHFPQISKWLYKDPAGNIQGPFSSEEMQEWYSAGFFPPSLLVKREDDPSFEPLGVLIRQIGDEKKPFLALQRPMHLPQMLPYQQIRSQFNRNFLSLPSSPVADKYNPMSAGSVRGGFDPFGAPLTSGFEQSALGFRRHLENQTRRMDLNLDSKLGSANPWGNNLFSPPLNPPSNGNSQFFGENIPMGNGSSGFGLDGSRAAFERHHYLQAMQQRQKMQVQQFLQFQQQQQQQQQQPHSSGYQNDLMGKMMLQTSSQPNYEPLLVNRGVPLNPTGNNWGITNGNDMFKEAPFTQFQTNSQKDPWVQAKPQNSPGGGWSGLGAVTSGISLATEFDHPVTTSNGPKDELIDSTNSALAQLRLEEERLEVNQKKDLSKEGSLDEGEQNTDEQTTSTSISRQQISTEVPEQSLNKQSEPSEEPSRSTISAISTPNAWSRAGSAHGSPSTSFATLTPWVKISDEGSSAHSSPRALPESHEVEVKPLPPTEAENHAPSTAELTTGKTSELIKQEIESAVAWQSTSAPKKSILEIQKEEEEASKLRSKLQENQARGNNPTKRYADTVASSKPAPITGWTTILGGKSTSLKTATESKTVDPAGRPASQTQSKSTEVSNGSKKSATSIQDPKPPSPEFLNWCRNALKGLSGINTDDLIQMLLTFPLDPPPATMDIIAESVYAYSSSMDGRRFASEYVKRRKVDAGLVPSTVLESVSSQAMVNSFQVVTKKKGRKNPQ